MLVDFMISRHTIISTHNQRTEWVSLSTRWL